MPFLVLTMRSSVKYLADHFWRIGSSFFHSKNIIASCAIVLAIRLLCVALQFCSKAMAWSEEETIKLMELWGDDSVQEQPENCVRNRSVYDKLSRQMEAATRSAVQCREKI